MILNVPSFAATAPATTSQTETNFIDRFFTKDFTFLNKQGQDITDYFYETMTSKHEAGDYAAIENFLLENVSEAEACTKSFQPVARASTLRLMSVSRDFYKVVDDEIHGYENWNAFYGEVELQYYVDTLTSTMTSAKSRLLSLLKCREVMATWIRQSPFQIVSEVSIPTVQRLPFPSMFVRNLKFTLISIQR